jgi:hypothetical protein
MAIIYVCDRCGTQKKAIESQEAHFSGGLCEPCAKKGEEIDAAVRDWHLKVRRAYQLREPYPKPPDF